MAQSATQSAVTPTVRRYPSDPQPAPVPHQPPLEQALLSISLLVLSFLTTISAGAVLMDHFLRGAPPFSADNSLFPLAWILRHPERVNGGWSFSLTLLAILTAHELGHYLACRYHRVHASLPWVLPAPTLIGTFGAFIRLRSRVPSRRALLDIGLAGPLAGILVAIPAVIAGLALSRVQPDPSLYGQTALSVSIPLGLSLLHSIARLFEPSIPSLGAGFNPHPVLIAAWVGLFITSFNLIPAGQLDGGHILYAISPRLHRWSTEIITVLLFVAGTIFWVGWLVWACFLLIPSLRHPALPDRQPVCKRRMALAIVGMILFVLTFTIQPFAGASLVNYLH